MKLFTPRWKIEAQNLTCNLNETKFIISDKQLESAIRIFVNGRMRIIRESQEMVNETKNPEVFFGRLDSLIKLVEELCQLDTIKSGLLKPSPKPQLYTMKEKLPIAIDEMIDRSWNDTKIKAASLKSEKSKRNKFDKFFAILANYRNRMYPRNNEHIKTLELEVEKLCSDASMATTQYKTVRKLASAVDNTDICVKPDIGLARALFSSIQLDGEVSTKYKKQVDELIKGNPSQQNVARIVVALCGEPSNIDGLELISEACSWAGAAYREKTIFWTEKLLKEAGSFHHIEEPRRAAYQASIWRRLAQAFEGEYKFDEAYSAYCNAGKIDKSFMPYMQLADLLVKMNRFDEAITMLESTKVGENSRAADEYDTLYPCLLKDDWYIKDYKKMKQQHIDSAIESIDRKIDEIREKKARGYVYKPRKRKLLLQEDK